MVVGADYMENIGRSEDVTADRPDVAATRRQEAQSRECQHQRECLGHHRLL
jgi:hypothetical protein